MKHPRLNGLTKEAITKAAKQGSPGTIRKWSVVIEGREFPVKQIIMEAANILPTKSPRVTPADFIAHDAVRMLKRLGFDVRYAE
jgi:hypothetical protein